MTSEVPDETRNHVLLIGIDDYAGQPLSGCVNDVLAVARLLRDKFGVGDDEMTLLASPAASRTVPGSRPATATAIRAALDRFASDEVREGDRVIIHYSGHGGAQIVGQRRTSVECLLPVDWPREGAVLMDAEVNRRLWAIAERTANVTVVLDCCHSAGASRAVDEHGVRTRGLVLPPLPAESMADGGAEFKAAAGARRPLVVAACLADEVAGEAVDNDGRSMGLLTRALVTCLDLVSPEELSSCCWRELWPEVLGMVTRQHPRLIGDDMRHVFGADAGEREPGDVRVKPVDGRYQVLAGSLLDVTDGAEIAVYGREPPMLPRPGSAADRDARCGTLRVDRAERGCASAIADSAFEWPNRARCRVVKYGAPRLRAAIEGELAAGTRDQLAQVGVECVDAAVVDVDVRVVADAGQWVLCDELFGLASAGLPELARFGAEALVRVLGHCVRYRAPLRLVRRCTDLPGALVLRALDARIPVLDPQNPQLPDLAGPGTPRLKLALGQPFCLELSNQSDVDLQVTLVNMASGGQIQYVGDVSSKARTVHAFWNGRLGQPFCLMGPAGFERIVAIGTTCRDVNFDTLFTEVGFDSIIVGKRNLGVPEPLAPSERWTATMLTIRADERSASQRH
jgi:hypothetical protein